MNINPQNYPAIRGRQPARLPLTPGQATYLSKLEGALGVAAIVAVVGPRGSGRTTLMHHLLSRHDGVLIDLARVVMATRSAHELRADEAIGDLIKAALEQHDLVVLDDMDSYRSMFTRFARGHLFAQQILPGLCEMAGRLGKQLIMVGMPTQSWDVVGDLYGERATLLQVPDFTAEDYAAIAGNLLDAERLADVDFELLHHHASQMNGRQLRLMCELVADEAALDTRTFVKCLEELVLRSNLDLREVEALEFSSLPGSEHIVEALETHVVLPFENPELAARLGIKPKRGVLLHGPPGTGKTSIGRALAHRMKGKFFLIDGTFVTEPPGAFMGSVHAMVSAAKANAPAVLFIDDADVLFNIEHVGGLARYLLTVLDGLESEKSSHVCVMMTAMDVRKVPQALTRSGRVELWLETSPPDEATRARILARWASEHLPGITSADFGRLSEATEGFTPADLRRVSNDACLLYADDIVAGRATQNADHYLTAAINDIVAVRGNMADLLNDDALRVGQRIPGACNAQ